MWAVGSRHRVAAAAVRCQPVHQVASARLSEWLMHGVRHVVRPCDLLLAGLFLIHHPVYIVDSKSMLVTGEAHM